MRIQTHVPCICHVTDAPAAHPVRPHAAAPQGVPVDYARFAQTLRAAKHAPHPATRAEFLDFYAHHVAPALPAEETALQLLATRLSGMYLCPGHSVALRIRHNWDHAPVQAYATEYQVAERLNDTAEGCLAFLLRPANDAQARAIILFGGTANGVAGDVLALQAFPRGLRADFDPRGIGHAAFERNAATLVSWVEQEQAAGREVMLLGHSLGGALAMRAMAALSPAQQRSAHLLTVHAPGINAEAVARIVPGGRNVRHITHRFAESLDPVILAGEAYPGGVWFTLSGWDGCRADGEMPHGTATSAAQALDGKQVRFERHERPVVRNSRAVEAVRQGVCTGFRDRMPV